MNKINLVFLVFSIIFLACKSEEDKLIDKVCKVSGSDKIKDKIISFTFREKNYVIDKTARDFTYKRIQKDSTGNTIIDVLNNDGLKRFINDNEVSVADSMKAKYANSINSVAYFFLIPEPLKDPAVLSSLIGTSSIFGKNYKILKVTFKAENGGQDHDDQYLYWVDENTNTIDYFAYSFNTDGGGVRFREAFDRQYQNGVAFCNYKNYGFDGMEHSINDLEALFKDKKLPLLSTIINENVKIVDK